MPVPKRRTSKSKRDKRRAHDALVPAAVRRDPESGDLHLSHRAHKGEDGAWYYRGRQITEAKE